MMDQAILGKLFMDVSFCVMYLSLRVPLGDIVCGHLGHFKSSSFFNLTNHMLSYGLQICC